MNKYTDLKYSDFDFGKYKLPFLSDEANENEEKSGSINVDVNNSYGDQELMMIICLFCVRLYVN